MASSIVTGITNFQPGETNTCPVTELPLYYAECAKNPHMDFTDKMKYEIIRYSTFSKYKKYSSIAFMKLSRAGFYYDVLSDSVRCFKCKYKYDIHTCSNEDPMDIHYKYSPQCSFVRENYSASHYSSGVVREDTNYPEIVRGAAGGPSDIPNSDSYHTHVVSTENTLRPSINTVSHTSENLSVVTENRDSRNTAISPYSSSSQPNLISSQTSMDQYQQKAREKLKSLGIYFEKPKIPRYAILATRLASFKNWPKSAIVSPDDLARAGFFYYDTREGTKDQVCCFFCGGGLEEWEIGDEPWTEHAQWFPNCTFVKQCKGVDFITQTHEQKQLANKSEEEFFKSSAFQSAIQNGYTSEQIKQAHDAWKCKESILPADQFQEMIWESEKRNQSDYSQTENLDKQSRNSDGIEQDDINNDKKSNTSEFEELILEHEKLKEQSLCKICMDEDALVVLLPCGHMCTCVHCAPAMLKCPICKHSVKGTIKAILS